MHIALVSRWFPPHTGFGGVAMHVLYLGRALVAMGHRVTVIAARWSLDVPARHDADGMSVRRILLEHRAWMHRVPLVGSHARSLVQGYYSRLVCRELLSMAGEDRPDVVEFADVEAEGYAYIRKCHRSAAVLRCHTPMFLLHRYYLPEERPWYKTRTERKEKYCISHAETLTSPSHHMAATIARECDLPEDRVHVIPNPLDPECYLAPDPDKKMGTGSGRVLQNIGNCDDRPVDDHSAPVPIFSDDSGVTILHVGRLDRGKGIEVLAKAIPPVLAKVPSCRFVFIGDDCSDGKGSTWRKRLESQLAAAGVDKQVTFLGGLDQAELNAWYRKADLAVVPSLIYESFSYTCAQAAAAGMPVIASRIGGIPETIEDGVAGLIVNPGKVQELADAIIRLAADSELRAAMGAAGRAKAIKDFRSDVVAASTLPVYEQAIERHAGRSQRMQNFESTLSSQ